MEISKTTHNFAERRNLCITTHTNDATDQTILMIFCEELSDMEPIVQYSVEETGLFYHSQIFTKIEDLPRWVSTEKQLREVIDFISVDQSTVSVKVNGKARHCNCDGCGRRTHCREDTAGLMVCEDCQNKEAA